MGESTCAGVDPTATNIRGETAREFYIEWGRLIERDFGERGEDIIKPRSCT